MNTMRNYGLSEFALLLRLDLWNGGTVARLGYACPARELPDSSRLPGLTGVYLGSGVMLERSHPDESALVNLIFSVYDPYSGVYHSLSVFAAFTSSDIRKALQEEEKASKRTFSSRDYTPLRDKRRYEAIHSSYRSGSIPVPGRRIR